MAPKLSTLRVCPTCAGSGTYHMPVTTFTPEGRTDTVTPMRCLTCKATGYVTPATLRALARAAAFWCRCKVPCEFPTVHMTPRGCVDWVECTTCHKATQVG